MLLMVLVPCIYAAFLNKLWIRHVVVVVISEGERWLDLVVFATGALVVLCSLVLVLLRVVIPLLIILAPEDARRRLLMDW